MEIRINKEPAFLCSLFRAFTEATETAKPQQSNWDKSQVTKQQFN